MGRATDERESGAGDPAGRIPATGSAWEEGRPLGAEAGVRGEDGASGGVLGGTVDAMRSIPGFAKLLWRLLRDPRVSALDRALFGFTLAYAFMPVDVIPDWIPVLGGLDDLVLIALALDRLLYRTDRGVLLEHWDGDPRPLLTVRKLLDRVADALPWWAQGLIRS